ncbi:hypothetical protein JVU11DRAFT_11560 [Chiua virens]|nr:hypothetical protein JVU11DRAFT_11560 [Chiua virens]
MSTRTGTSAHLHLFAQGASDMGTRLSERELQNALDFCSKFFEPTDPEQRVRALRNGLPGHLFGMSLAPVDPKELGVVLVGPRNEDQKTSDSERKDRLSLVEMEVRSAREMHAEWCIASIS